MHAKISLRILTLAAIMVITILSGCQFLLNTLSYRNTSKEFMEALIREDYDQCMSLFAVEYEWEDKIHPDTVRALLPAFRDLVVNNFGEDLDYSLMQSEKKISTEEENSTPPNTTRVYIQIANKEEFGVLNLMFYDPAKKIVNVSLMQIKEKIPNMLPFWLFGFIALCIPAFNIYVINQIRKSNFKRKWLKYLAVIVFNAPTITYSAISGFTFKLLFFQILLGVSLSYTGYMNAIWSFGIPFGGLYWLWKVKAAKEAAEWDEISGPSR
ncbi:MAG: hypothetical protein R3D00_10365 [Bacteroidia bacterium]